MSTQRSTAKQSVCNLEVGHHVISIYRQSSNVEWRMFIDDLWFAINLDAITDHQSTHELLISVHLLSIEEVLLY